MRLEAVEVEEFMSLATRSLRGGGVDELARAAATRWTPRQLSPLLQQEQVEVRKLACLVLASIGDHRAVGSLTAALRDSEATVSQLAEQALWSIWFRDGSHEAQIPFRRGLEEMSENKLDDAVTSFREASVIDPEFTESFNQCATAHYLAQRWVESIELCEKVLERQRAHFGAMAGLGHAHLQMGNFAEASRWYRHALKIHPRMHTVAHALSRIDCCLERV